MKVFTLSARIEISGWLSELINLHMKSLWVRALICLYSERQDGDDTDTSSEVVSFFQQLQSAIRKWEMTIQEAVMWHIIGPLSARKGHSCCLCLVLVWCYSLSLSHTMHSLSLSVSTHSLESTFHSFMPTRLG